MKKTTLLIAALLVSVITFAGQADLFDVNEQAINQEFSNLTQLENFVSTNNFVSLDEIAATNSYDLSAINVNSLSTSGQGDFSFAWDGFLWGFLCCPIGFFVVAINGDKSKDQKMSFWIGVGAGVLFSALTSPTYYSY